MSNGNGTTVWRWLAGLFGVALITGAGAFLVLGADTPSRGDMNNADNAVEKRVKDWVNTHKESNKETLIRLDEGLKEVQKEQTEMKIREGEFQSEVRTKLDLVIEQLKRRNN